MSLRAVALTTVTALALALGWPGAALADPVDNSEPITATIVVADTLLIVKETTLVTFTFSEAVSGFTNDDIEMPDGTLTAVTSVDGGLTFTATYRPAQSTTTATSVITVDLTGVTDAAANAGVGTAVSNSFAIDTKVAAVVILVADTSINADETSLVTFRFSEAVTEFTNKAVRAPSGSLTTVSSSDGGIVWTATFTPASDTTAYNIRISVNYSGIKDLVGNQTAGTTGSNSFSIDTKRPTATLTVADTALTAGETTLVTVTFSQAISGLDAGDITAANGMVSAPSSSDGGITWSTTLTPSADTVAATNQVTLNLTGIANAAGSTGTGTAASNNYTINTVRPMASIVVADQSLKIGETSLVTITFSEAVSGLNNADLNVSNGTLSTVNSSDGGVTWTATFTPASSSSSTGNVIALDQTGVSNGSGNAGAGTVDSNTFTIDTQRPTATILLDDTVVAIGDTPLVKITFSEAVIGFDNADISASNGRLSAVSSADGGITWTATLTPSWAIEATTNVISLAGAGITDLAGNAGTGTITSANYTVDTNRAVARIVVADSVLTAGETSLVTVKFFEAITGFDNSDLTVENGSLSPVTSADGGFTWTATLTPTSGVNASSNYITLYLPGVIDASGNTGDDSGDDPAVSGSYRVATVRPTATVLVPDDSLSVGDSTRIVITFSRAVSGLTGADISHPNLTLGSLTTLDGGVTWSASVTPNADITDASNVLAVDLTGVTESSGNTGIGTADSNNYAVDTERPTATVLLDNLALTVGQTSLVTITFSEAVTGFDNTALTLPNGALSDVSSVDGGTTFTATFTPTADITDSTNVITAALSGVTDLPGNAGEGTVDSANYSVDTVLPTASIVVDDTSLMAGDSAGVTITFNQPVTGFDHADLAVANGTLSTVTSADGGVTYTATLTPTADVVAAANLITLDLTGVRGSQGNAGVGSVKSNRYGLDTLRPTATVVAHETELAAGESSLVTVTFSEAVTGFDSADLSVANGTVTGFGSADGGITWTGTLIPSPGITVAANLITLDLAGIKDAAGNAGIGSAESNSYAINTVTPPPAALPAGPSKPGAIPVAPDSIDIAAAARTITLSDDTLAPGGRITVSGLVPGQWYFTWFFSTPIPTAWQLSSAAGTVEVTVPTGLAAGSHRIIVQDAAGAVYGWAALTVRSELPPATTAPSVLPSGGLAQTGIDAGTLSAAAGWLLLVGLLIGGFANGLRRRSAL